MDYYGDYLAHYGVLGMKWGVRRYQNKDGTLTKAGEKRLAKAQDVVSSLTNKKSSSGSSSSSTKKKKRVSDMSDDELNASINRMQKEQTYLTLQSNLSRLQPQKVSAGKKIVNELGQQLKSQVVPKLMSSVGDAVAKSLSKSLEKSLGLKNVDAVKQAQDAATIARSKWQTHEYTEKLKKAVADAQQQTQQQTKKTESAEKKSTEKKTTKKSSDTVIDVDAKIIDNESFTQAATVGEAYVRAFFPSLPEKTVS